MSVDTHGSNLLFNDLRERIADQRVIAVVGAGVAISVTQNDPVASWVGLLESGITRCVELIPNLPATWSSQVRSELKSGDIDDLLSVAGKIESKLKRVNEYSRWLLDTIGRLQVKDSSVIDSLIALRIPIVTTNYDGLIEKHTGLEAVTWKDHAKYERVIQKDLKGVLHLHGFYDETDSVILGAGSYERLLSDEYAQAMQHAIRSYNSLLFVGYGKGLEDPNFSALLKWA